MNFPIFILFVVTACAYAQVRPRIGYRRSSFNPSINDWNPYYTQDITDLNASPKSWSRSFDLQFDDDDNNSFNNLAQRVKAKTNSLSQSEIDDFRDRFERFRKNFDRFSLKLIEMIDRIEPYTY